MARGKSNVTRREFFRRSVATTVGAATLGGAFDYLIPGSLFAYAAGPRSCGPPKKAKPQRRKGGEGFAPLPLPVTPLRRTEKKRPPAPPTLVGKVAYGDRVWATDENGKRYSYLDWTTDPGDMQTLLRWVGRHLGVRYRPVTIDLGRFSFDPGENPILYFTGHETIKFDPATRGKLRQFVLDGGYILADACCGTDAFNQSFVKEITAMFPRRPLRRIEVDHPLYKCFYPISKVSYQEGKSKRYQDAPRLMGINVGCRTAVIFSPYDLSCGWAGHTHDHGKRVGIADARSLGSNIVTYCLANYQLGRFLATSKVYHQDHDPTRDEFVFGQIMHSGDWDPAPSAAAELLKYVAANSSMDVQFKRANVDLGKADAFNYPLLYMTGHYDFQFSDAEIINLRNYLKSGGLLLADACCGRPAFDAAFRREMARVLPGKSLEAVPVSHPIFSSRVNIRQVEYTPYALNSNPSLSAPEFECITLGGVPAVIYTRHALGSMWDGGERPYSDGYATDDARRLGMNVIVYAMTH
ncbi:MAG: DUF4159 domain-containing protein [Planctomycetes bacterium]|nr:DUF4159 domain-containing protein [Planctomycetota bacterium]